jgi:hypothetical protein
MDSLAAFYQNACVAEGVETNSALVKLFLQLETGIIPPSSSTVVIQRTSSKLGTMGMSQVASGSGRNRSGPLGEMPAAEVAAKPATAEAGSTSGVVPATAHSRTAALTELDFSNHYLGGKSVTALCRTLTTLRMLRTVSFRSVGLDEVAHAAIAQWATAHPSLKELDVSSNPCFASSGRLYTSMLEKNHRIVVFRVDYHELPDRIASKLKIVLGRNIAKAFPLTESSGCWGKTTPGEGKEQSKEADSSDVDVEENARANIWARFSQLSPDERDCLQDVISDKELFLSWYTRFGLWACQLVSDFGIEGLRLLESYKVAQHASIRTRDRSTDHTVWPGSIRGTVPSRMSRDDSLETQTAVAVTDLIQETLRPFRVESWTPSLGQLLNQNTQPANGQPAAATSVVSEESQAVLQVQLEHLRALAETIIREIQQQPENAKQATNRTKDDILQTCTATFRQFTELLQHVKRRLGMCAVDTKTQPTTSASTAGSSLVDGSAAGLLAIQLECDLVERQVIDELFIQKRTLRLLKDEAQYLAHEFPTAFAKSKVRIFSVPVAPPPPPTPTPVVELSQGKGSRTPTERSSPSSVLSKPSTPTQEAVLGAPQGSDSAPTPRPPTGQRSQPATSFRAERVVQYSSGVPALEVQRRYAMCEVPLRCELGDALDEVLVSLRLGDAGSTLSFGQKRRALLRRALSILPPRLSAFLLGLHWERCYSRRKTLSALEGYRSASLPPAALLELLKSEPGSDGGADKTDVVRDYTESLSELVGRLLAGPASVQFLGTEVAEEGDPLRILSSASFSDEKNLSLYCQHSAAWWRLRELLLLRP